MIARPLHLDRKTTALAIIDVQERLAPAMNAAHMKQAVANIGRLLTAAKLLSLPTLVSEQYPEGLGPTVGAIAEHLGDTPRVAKMEFDALKNAEFAALLTAAKPKAVILAGIEAHICVVQTAASLLTRGYDVWVARDAVASRTEANMEAGLTLMHDAGAKLAPTETILFWLLERAGTPEFKTVSKLVR
jgi:nicotinamidase-related amidase